MNLKLDTGIASKSAQERGKILKNDLKVSELIGMIDMFLSGLVPSVLLILDGIS
jgi:hypothetical protein